MKPDRRRLALALPLGLLAGGWCLAATVAWGHELGPFQVYGTFFRGGAFRLEVKVDEEHLGAAQMGGPARTTRYGRIAGLGGPVEQRFGRFLSDLADSFILSFDGVPVRPALSMDPEGSRGGGGTVAGAASGASGAGGAGGGPARATLRVEGWIPGGARAFTFATSLPVKSYPLVLHCEEDESSTWRWVAGGETSPAYRLPPRVVPPPRAAVARRGFALGFDRVLPHGPAPLLLVAAIFLLARRVRAALLMLAALALGQGLGLALALRGAAPIRPALLETLLALAIAGVAVAGLGVVPAPARLRASSGRPGGPAPAPLLRPAAALAVVVPLLIGVLLGLDLGAAVPGAPADPGGTVAEAAPAAPAAPAVPAAAVALTPPWLPAAGAGFALGAAAAELAEMAAAFILVGMPFRDKAWYRTRVVVPACCLIAVVSLYWSLSGLLS
ncbi:MAG: hypothetical protein JOZ15_13660 [Acidobacteria bacterium]|nr:hypothetical protein [Acidobacteriota bacterium]